MYLSYLKTFWFFFWVLLLRSCRWGQHSARSGANYSPLHQGIVAFHPFWWFFPVSGSFPPIYVLNVLILKKDPLKVSNVFFLSFPLFLPPPPFQFSVVICPVESTTLLSLDPQLQFCPSVSHPGSAWVSSPCTDLGESAAVSGGLKRDLSSLPRNWTWVAWMKARNPTR